jgi:hypothetical protein
VIGTSALQGSGRRQCRAVLKAAPAPMYPRLVTMIALPLKAGPPRR